MQIKCRGSRLIVFRLPRIHNKNKKDVFDSQNDKISIDGNEVKAGQELLYKVTYKNTTGKEQKVVISACLLGFPVRYDGGAKTSRAVQEFASKVEAMHLCPEVRSGLPTPRPPAEQRDGRIWLKDGTEVTDSSLGDRFFCASKRRIE